MSYSRKQLYALGEPFGDSATRKEGGRFVYGGGGSGGGGTQVTKQEIPVELKPLARAYTSKAMDLSEQSYNPYQGQRYEDLNAIQTTGLGMTVDRALQGSQTVNNAEAGLNQMMDGSANPYLDAMYNQAAGKVAGSVNSNFAQGGRYGSGAHTGALTEGLGNMATNLYGGAYEADQGRRMQAIGMAPQFAQQDYADMGQLMNAGQIIQDQNQQNRDFGYEQYQEEENLPYKQLAAMSGIFGSNLGGQSTTSGGGGGK
jgi:hypothetical protein